MAMQGFVTFIAKDFEPGEKVQVMREAIAEASVKCADALIAELAKVKS